jgi:hypothetical protein
MYINFLFALSSATSEYIDTHTFIHKELITIQSWFI